MDIGGIFSALIDVIGVPAHLLLLFVAVPVGMFFGAVPGLGGKLGIVLAIPFVFGMDPLAGAIFLIAMHAVVHTGGAIPSILFGVPGTGPDAATVVDGLPMTRGGEAGRAIGAALGASGVGGVIGGLFLLAILPLLRPVVLAFGPAEFFLLALFGITFIAMLSGDSLRKGLIVGLFGLLMACVNLDPQTGAQRYTFDWLFLWDGIDIITAVLGIFAIPEMIALGVAGGSIAEVRQSASYGIGGVLKGIRDVFRHWGLTARTSIMGAFIGMIPGLGGEAASWICYGHAVQSSRTPERFGKGAVEGDRQQFQGGRLAAADAVLRRAGLVGHGDPAGRVCDAGRAARTGARAERNGHRADADLGADARQHPRGDHVLCRCARVQLPELRTRAPADPVRVHPDVSGRVPQPQGLGESRAADPPARSAT